MATIAFGTKPLDGEIFFGEATGRRARKALKLDEADARGEKLVISLTPSVRSVTATFLAGLLGPSFKTAKSRQALEARLDTSACQSWFQVPLSRALGDAFPAAPASAPPHEPAPVKPVAPPRGQKPAQEQSAPVTPPQTQNAPSTPPQTQNAPPKPAQGQSPAGGGKSNSGPGAANQPVAKNSS